MVYLYDLKHVEGDIYLVGAFHFMPFDNEYGFGKTKEELEQEGILVESLPPKPESKPKKTIVTYINKQTMEIWYEYVDRSPTPEEEIQDLKETVADLWELILFGSDN